MVKSLNSVGTCINCKKEDTMTHLHHIVPKSKGGSNKSHNLIRLCLDCHSKVHDITFKGDEGVVKNGVKETRAMCKEASDWYIKHQTLVELFFHSLRIKNETLADYLINACNLGLLSPSDFYHFFGFTERYSQTSLKLTLALKQEILSVWKEVA